jgi:hypothetical protein
MIPIGRVAKGKRGVGGRGDHNAGTRHRLETSLWGRRGLQSNMVRDRRVEFASLKLFLLFNLHSLK